MTVPTMGLPRMTLARLRYRYHPVLAMLLLPSLLLIGVFSYYPALRSLVGGFYAWNGFSPPTYAGISQFKQYLQAPTFGAEVKNIREQNAQTATSITTVSLHGISRIEELFAIVLAAGAMGLFVALGLAERRQEFATMAALGAPLKRIGAFLWSEAALVLGAGMVLAAGLGWLLSKMLVAMLQHAFDPPPDALAIPWGFLAELGGAAVGATLLAVALAARGLRRLPLGKILREQ